MTNSESLLSEDLLLQVEEAARQQSRAPAEVVEEAVGRYLASQRLARFAEKAEVLAKAKGIREEDVPRIVDELRRGTEAGRS